LSERKLSRCPFLLRKFFIAPRTKLDIPVDNPVIRFVRKPAITARFLEILLFGGKPLIIANLPHLTPSISSVFDVWPCSKFSYSPCGMLSLLGTAHRPAYSRAYKRAYKRCALQRFCRARYFAFSNLPASAADICAPSGTIARMIGLVSFVEYLAMRSYKFIR